ncbi:hypothetical protein KR222_011269, partial [Zaprionus bogoriensis]
KDCGRTPGYLIDQIAGGNTVQPDEYSWVASLEYNNNLTSFGICAGSVINSLYVLTAAHCVTGQVSERYGNVSALRLGDFKSEPYCDYGGAVGCGRYQRFVVTRTIIHSDYKKDHGLAINDIALLRLDRQIQFDGKLQPICMPSLELNPPANWSLIACGWGLSMVPIERAEKRAVAMPVWDAVECNHMLRGKNTHICVGAGHRKPCSGDSGGPVMRYFQPKRMVLEGIISQGYMDCDNPFTPVLLTQVHSFQAWIEENLI